MRKPGVIAVIENGTTRCGLSRSLIGLGGLPDRLLQSCPEKGKAPRNVFQTLERILTEVSLAQYQEYLEHPENADDFSCLMEIDVDHGSIRIDEDMGEEREYHEYPLSQFIEKAWELKDSHIKSGNSRIAGATIYRVMRQIECSSHPIIQTEPGSPAQLEEREEMTMGGM